MAEGVVENIVKQGYLRRINTSNKRLSGLFRRQEGNKWFVLVVRQNCPYLHQYDADVDVFTRAPLHSYSLAQCKAVRSMGSSDPPTFCVVCADRVIELIAASRTQMLDWVNTVESCLVDLGIIKKEPVDHVYTVCPAVVRKPRVSKEVLEEREAEALMQAANAQVPTTSAPTAPSVSQLTDLQPPSPYNNNIVSVENRRTSSPVEGASAMEPRPRVPARSKTLKEATAKSPPFTLHPPRRGTGINAANVIDSLPPPLPRRQNSNATSSLRLAPQCSANPLIHPITDSSNDSDFVSPEVIAQLRSKRAAYTESSQPPSSSHVNDSYSLSNSSPVASNDVAIMDEQEDCRSSPSAIKNNCTNFIPVFPHKSTKDQRDPSDFSPSPSSSVSSLCPSPELEEMLGFPHKSLSSAVQENDYSLLPSDRGACAFPDSASDNASLEMSNKNPPSSISACSRDSIRPTPRPRHVLVKQDHLEDELQSSEVFCAQGGVDLNVYDNNLKDHRLPRSDENGITSKDAAKEHGSNELKDVNENCYGLIFDPSVQNIPSTPPIPPLPPRHDSLPEAPQLPRSSNGTLYSVVKHNGDGAPPLPFPRINYFGSVHGKSNGTFTSNALHSQDLEIPPMPPRRRPPCPSKIVGLDDGLKDKNDEDTPPALPSRPTQSFYIKRPQLMSQSTSDSSTPHAAAAANAHGLENVTSQPGLSRMMLLDRAHSLHTVVSLKQTQAEILQSEISMSSLTLTLTQKSGHGLALVDWNGFPCVAGWNQQDFPSLHGKLHLGDQLISVNGVKVPSSDIAQKLLKGSTTPKITVILHRMPYAKVFAIRRDAEGQSLGIKREGGSGESLQIPHFSEFYSASGNFCLFLLCVAADVDAVVSNGDDNDDGGDYYYDDIATHVHDDEEEDDDKI
ncbi:flocculation protein FLO11-like [Elysia marginata]|uniref:Flocculation protein FLO11-like n=1 Tax=Elysia marginata TaxID=1093978 RepID=A0AAV4FKK5_9GAST|nr:flocculation protein FLO11-like [Elysia marginata]